MPIRVEGSTRFVSGVVKFGKDRNFFTSEFSVNTFAGSYKF